MMELLQKRRRLRRLYERYRRLGGDNWERKGWRLEHTPENRIDRVCSLLEDAIARRKNA